MVDMIKYARRRAGMSVAFDRVFPTMAFIIVGLFIYASFFAGQQNKNTVIIAVGCAMLLTPVLMVLGYSLGRRNVKLLRRELEEVIDAEQVILALHETVAGTLTEQLENIQHIFREDFVRQWHETAEEQRTTTLRDLKNVENEMRQELATMKPRDKIRRQAYSLQLEQMIRDGEQHVATLQSLEVKPPPESAITAAMAASEEFMNAQKRRLEKERDAELEKAAKVVRTITEAESALQELQR